MKIVSFLIEVSLPDDLSTATVRISTDGDEASLAAQMVATEHMMTMFAASSDAGFEQALELLCDGARTNQLRAFGGKAVQ